MAHFDEKIAEFLTCEECANADPLAPPTPVVDAGEVVRKHHKAEMSLAADVASLFTEVQDKINEVLAHLRAEASDPNTVPEDL